MHGIWKAGRAALFNVLSPGVRRTRMSVLAPVTPLMEQNSDSAKDTDRICHFLGPGLVSMME